MTRMNADKTKKKKEKMQTRVEIGQSGSPAIGSRVYRGTVAHWDGKLGWGFIDAGAEGFERDVFVHHSGIIGARGRKNLSTGDQVEFNTVPGENGKGPKAVNVKVV